MKRVFVLTVLPLVLSALETVNLIKDAGFEKDSDVWLMRSEAEEQYDSTIINRHDSEEAYSGEYCGKIDTRTKPLENPSTMYYMRGSFCQMLKYPKKLSDLDTLIFSHLVFFKQEGNKYSARNYGLRLEFTDSDEIVIEAWYYWLAPDLDPSDDTPTEKLFPDTIYDEGTWHVFCRDIKTDLINLKGLSSNIELDSVIVYNTSFQYGIWRAQKTFFDGIRLTGYADYDVGIKEILSGDSLEKDTPYTPIARIKNFGREDASDFSVIAEIFEGETRIYYDSLPWSLTSDTEDTVTFTAFTPSSVGNHTLTIRTIMEPDESDEDDEMTKTLFGSGIEEPVTQPSSLQLEVSSLSTIRYSLPPSEHGTLTLYDATGRRIESLKVQGTGQVNLRSELASGVYFVKLESGKVNVTRKAVILR